MDGQEPNTLLRWGFIGCGAVTEQKSGPAFQQVTGSTVTAVMSRSYHKARDYADRHQIPRAHDRIEELINDTSVDAIYIATPPGAHIQPALAAAEAGKPAYIEKPLARTYDEALSIVQAFEEKGVPLFVAYYRRALPKVQTLQALLRHEAIGPVHSFQVTLQKPQPVVSDTSELPWRLRPEVAGGGLFMDLAPHAIDLIQYLLGAVTTVQASVQNFSQIAAVEDHVSAVFTLDNGVTGVGQWDFSGANYADEMVIRGERGTLAFGIHSTDPLVVCNENGEQSIPHETPAVIQEPMISDVVGAINGRAQHATNAHSAARVNWVTDQILTDFPWKTP